MGFVQISGYQYGGASRPDPSADVRQAQLAALALPHVAVATTIDTGDWSCIHPPDKQTPSHRLATAALDQVYGMKQFEAAHSPPLFAGQSIVARGHANHDGNTVRVRVKLSRPATTVVSGASGVHASAARLRVRLVGRRRILYRGAPNRAVEPGIDMPPLIMDRYRRGPRRRRR